MRRKASRAVETDLAELIVRLAGDRPSHIRVPAIHDNRGQIRDLFRDRIGDEPTARAHLRETFLRAKVTVSGTDSVIAETGSGPSATSDIELDRVEGVHGPRRLDVVIVGHRETRMMRRGFRRIRRRC